MATIPIRARMADEIAITGRAQEFTGFLL